MSLNRSNNLKNLKKINPTLHKEYLLLQKKNYGLSPTDINAYLQNDLQSTLNNKFSEKLFDMNVQPEGKPQISKQEKSIKRLRISNYREGLRNDKKDVLHIKKEDAPEIQDVMIEFTSKESFEKSRQYLTSINKFERDINIDFIEPQKPMINTKFRSRGIATFSYDNNISRTAGGTIAIRNEDIGVFFKHFGLEDIVSSYEDILKNAYATTYHKPYEERVLNLKIKQNNSTLEDTKKIKSNHSDLTNLLLNPKEKDHKKIYSHLSGIKEKTKVSDNKNTLYGNRYNNMSNNEVDNNEENTVTNNSSIL